jgi:hypothetical protein
MDFINDDERHVPDEVPGLPGARHAVPLLRSGYYYAGSCDSSDKNKCLGLQTFCEKQCNLSSPGYFGGKYENGLKAKGNNRKRVDTKEKGSNKG